MPSFGELRLQASENCATVYGKGWHLYPSAFVWIRVRRDVVGKSRGVHQPVRDWKVPAPKYWPGESIPKQYLSKDSPCDGTYNPPNHSAKRSAA